MSSSLRPADSIFLFIGEKKQKPSAPLSNPNREAIYWILIPLCLKKGFFFFLESFVDVQTEKHFVFSA